MCALAWVDECRGTWRRSLSASSTMSGLVKTIAACNASPTTSMPDNPVAEPANPAIVAAAMRTAAIVSSTRTARIARQPRRCRPNLSVRCHVAGRRRNAFMLAVTMTTPNAMPATTAPTLSARVAPMCR